MMRQPRRIATAAALVGGLCLAPLSAQAGPWLLPSDTNFSGSDPWVAIDAGASDDLFYLDHAMNLDDITVQAPDGSKLPLENAMRGRSRSTFDVRLTQEGTTRIFTATSNVMGSYVVDGVTYRLNTFRRGPGGPGGAGGGGAGAPGGAQAGGPAGRPSEAGRPQPGVSDPAQIPANATGVKLVQARTRTETFVTRGAPTPLKPTGVGLELAGDGTAPTDVAMGELARLRLLLDGQPAAGVTVTVIAGDQRYLKGPADMTLTTRADGGLTVKWPAPGRYLLTATAEGAGTIPNAVRRTTYNAILEVQKP